MANGGPKNKPNLPKYRKEKGVPYNFNKDNKTNAGGDQPFMVYERHFKVRPSKRQLDKVKANTPMRNAAIDKLIYRYEP
jgi:hypothetical protein|tara:strand:- start:103 stop:339 length:237 start_codon:yes stop_codon:yes gene_type:complete